MSNDATNSDRFPHIPKCSKHFIFDADPIFDVTVINHWTEPILLTSVGVKVVSVAFYSLLSIVPIIALMFGIAKGFGLQTQVEEQLLAKMEGQKEVVTKIIDFSNSLLASTSGGVIAGIGVALLFWTIISVLSNIENSFNGIWGVIKPRSFGRKFGDYLSMILVCPILLVISGSATIFISSQVQTGQKQRIFGQFMYAAETWDCQRRVIVKAEHLPQGANHRFVVTNLDGQPQKLYDELYCQRGEAENRIKEQQLGLFADRTSCHDFVANQFRVLLSAAAYILVDTLRREGLANSELANAQVGTIRLKLLKVGARVVHSVRRIVVHLAGGYPLKELFVQVLSRISCLRPSRLSFGFG